MKKIKSLLLIVSIVLLSSGSIFSVLSAGEGTGCKGCCVGGEGEKKE